MLDITDLSRFDDGGFDAVVCFGGPLSYVLDRAEGAFDELVRVTRGGGHVLASVMSLWGSLRAFLPGVVGDAQAHGLAAVEETVERRLVPPALSSTATLRFFTWAEVEALLRGRPCRLVQASAANFLAAGHDELLETVHAEDPRLWEALLRWEEQACRAPGALDAGTLILFTVRRQ